MLFIILTFLSALLLEGIGTIVSVIGLVQLFGYSELIVALAIAFDFGKLVAVTVLYREWQKLGKLLKLYLTLASFVLMTITSMGALSYLSTNFQKNSLPVKTLEVKVKSLVDEKQKLEARKLEIDKQITNLPAETVRGRTKLMASFKAELEQVNNRIVELDVEVPKAQTEIIEVSSHAGPIMYLASALKVSPDSAMGYLIALIIFVFDPMAIALILAGNYLVSKRELENLQPQESPIASFKKLPDLIDDELTESTEDLVELYSKPSSDPITLTLEELEPIEDRDDGFYPYFSEEIVEQARTVAEPAIADLNKKEPVFQSTLTAINADKADVVFDDGTSSTNIPSLYTKNL